MSNWAVSIETRWRGRPLSELTRDELIGVIHEMHAGHQAQLAERDRSLDVLLEGRTNGCSTSRTARPLAFPFLRCGPHPAPQKIVSCPTCSIVLVPYVEADRYVWQCADHGVIDSDPVHEVTT